MEIFLFNLYKKWPEVLLEELEREGVKVIVEPKKLDSLIFKAKRRELNIGEVEFILRNLETCSKEKPYKDSEIKIQKINSAEDLYTYQTFVEKRKLKNIQKIKNLNWPTIFIYEEKATLYFLPIIDVYKKGIMSKELRVIRDGTHRVYSYYKNGKKEFNVVFLTLDKLILPSYPVALKDVKEVDKKPKLNDRYINLNKNFWIDLKSSGIDG